MAQIFNVSAEECSLAAFSGAHLAIGVFDGVHQGHERLIGELPHDSGPRGVLTFAPDPDEVLFPGRMKKIMSNERRVRALAGTDVDFVAVLSFDEVLSQLGPLDFLNLVFGPCVPSSIHVGAGFRFGHKASGAIDDLQAWGSGRGCEAVEIPLLEVDGARVSATRIRGLLAEGKVTEANKLLGHGYLLEGVVERGRQEGTGMGFATANLKIAPELDALGAGVYAAYANVLGTCYKAAVSVGVSPTFEHASATCEAHILDFEGDLYGQPLELEFVEYLRPMRKFDDVDLLIATVKGNIEWVRNNL